MDDREDIKHVSQKWGFGMAPLKDSHIAKTVRSIEVFLGFIDNPHLQPTDDQLSCMSHVKGQFTRCSKQDQWDWFTVWTRLGKPGRATCNGISNNIKNIRDACKKQDANLLTEAILTITRLGIHRCLHNYLNPRTDEAHEGFIYILSTREQSQFLKIGVTTRSVEQRVKEINSATGVIIPFGVRAVWPVRDPEQTEKDIHKMLAPYRVRADREFFQIGYQQACKMILDLIKAKDLELRR
jgi:hypothetical protein